MHSLYSPSLLYLPHPKKKNMWIFLSSPSALPLPKQAFSFFFLIYASSGPMIKSSTPPFFILKSPSVGAQNIHINHRQKRTNQTQNQIKQKHTNQNQNQINLTSDELRLNNLGFLSFSFFFSASTIQVNKAKQILTST